MKISHKIICLYTFFFYSVCTWKWPLLPLLVTSLITYHIKPVWNFVKIFLLILRLRNEYLIWNMASNFNSMSGIYVYMLFLFFLYAWFVPSFYKGYFWVWATLYKDTNIKWRITSWGNKNNDWKNPICI